MTFHIGWRSTPFARKALRHPALSSRRSANSIVEPEDTLLHAPRASTPQRGAHPSGYSQSERCGQAHAAQIHQGLRGRQPLGAANERTADRIRGARSASVHARRGDDLRSTTTTAPAVTLTCSS